MREKLIALSRRVPQEPKMPRVKQAPKMPAGSLMTGGESAGWLTGGGDAIVANLIPNDDHSIWADIFWKAANEFHDPWDFDIFLAVLLGICHQETTFRNIRQNGMNVGRDGIEWHLAPQEKNLFDKSDTNPIDLWRLDFVNEKGSLGLDMEAGVGPMQLTDPGLKKQADELFASKGGKSNPVHDQWSGGRWDITSNIFTAAKYFKGCLGMTGMDPSTGDQLAAMWLACSAYNAGHIIPNFPYSNSVKKWVLNDPGYLTKVKDAMTTARTENKQTGGDRISEGSTGSKIMPGGWPNEEQCIAAFRGKWAGPGNLFAKDGTLSTVEKALINIGDLTPAEFRQYKTVCAALYCYYNQDKMVYNNNRPVNDKFQPPPYVPDALDCSAFTTYCFAVSGCPDPNGANYRGGMNTATLWQQGRLIGGETVKANQLRPGDMCFYAYGTPLHAGNSEHVTIYIGNGKCISQGSDEGPLLLPYNESSKPFVGARRYQF
jgi:hypothetical protein